MIYQKQELISEGKTKRVWATNNPRHAIAEFYDDAMMYHAKKKVYFKNKSKVDAWLHDRFGIEQ